MQSITVKYIVTAAIGVLCCAGCHRPAAEAPAPLPVEQVAPAVRQAFASADEDIKSEASQCETAAQNNDWPGVFAQLRQLRSHPELTEEQRATLARIQLTTVQQLNDSAAKGDDSAAAAMSDYKASR